MHPHIGIGMPDETAVEWNGDTAERHGGAGPEGVDVEAVAGADVHGVSDAGPGAVEIRGRGDLEVILVARDDPDLEPGLAGNRRVVERLAGVAPVRGENIGKPESLRCLGPPEPVPPGRGDGPAVLIGTPESVDDPQGGQGGRSAVEGLENGGDQRRTDERPGGIMDENPVWRKSRKRLEAGADRGSPAGAARDRRQQSLVSQPIKTPIVERPVVGMDDHLEHVDGRMSQKRVDRPAKHRTAPEGQVLLRRSRAEPLTSPGGHDQSCRSHRVLPKPLRRRL